MDSAPTPSSAISRDRAFSANHAVSRAGIDRDVPRNVRPVRRIEENRPPATLPKAFESMLKTTTETGDIGMFSIKPSRVPPPMNSPRRLAAYAGNDLQKPQQAFQPYGVPSVDDRRRLPSYSRDPASELISMYQSPSQKSSRVFDDADYRSYSMTQTTSYTLSNHRSYTSLRSQPEGGPLLQRPRSPFAYPTRLKRPGFRPSSPALTDGGGVDYRRRAEIDRTPYGAGHITYSPSSLYAQKRMPPLALRPEGNKSTPSLLCQPSPPRRSSSPLVPHSNGNIGHDWPCRNGLASVNTSPARSTFSLSSTVNIFPTYLSPSTTTTPGKPQPASPLYYDYTEDFETEEYTQPIVRDPPPQFRIAETIPEDRATNPDQPSLVDTNTRTTASLSSGVRVSSSSASIHQVSVHEGQDQNGSVTTEPRWPIRKASLGARNGAIKPSIDPIEIRKENNNSANSAFKHNAQELNNNADKVVFGISSSPLLTLIGQKNGKEPTVDSAEELKSAKGIQGQIPAESKLSSPAGVTIQTMGLSRLRSSSFVYGNSNMNGNNQAPQERENHGPKPRKLASSSSPVRIPNDKRAKHGAQYNQKRSSSLDSTAARSKRVRSSGFSSVDTSFTELADLISSLEIANRSQCPETVVEKSIIPPERNAMVSPTIPERVLTGRSSSSQNISPALFAFSTQAIGSTQTNMPDPQPKRTQGHQRTTHQEPAQGRGSHDIPGFSTPMPRKSVSRSGSPMLAPKPISPARQLKLKNSVPQLMKALPPLPPDGPTRLGPPPAEVSPVDETKLPCNFSRILPEGDSTVTKGALSSLKSAQTSQASSKQTESSKITSESSVTSALALSSTAQVSLNPTTLQSPPRMKLKLRNSGILSNASPHDSRPWNSEENYPWANHSTSIRLPSLIKDDKSTGSKAPKFKLKLSHNSNVTSETVRVNRDSADSRLGTGLHLPNPKDLFTPVAGLDSIFRQVGKHIHSRKSSANSSPLARESTPAPAIRGQTISTDKSHQSEPQSNDLVVPPIIPSEVKSFFSDDSSNIPGRHSLRKRFSNLRAKIVVPYGMRTTEAQSCDDVTLRSRNRPEDARPYAARSVPNLHDSIETDSEDETLRRSSERIHRRRLREKLSKWLKGARSAIAARVRSLSLSGWGDDERV